CRGLDDSGAQEKCHLARRAKYERRKIDAMIFFDFPAARSRKNFPAALRARPSDFVISDACSLAAILCGVNLEIREESRRLALQQSQRRHGRTANFQLGAFARAELEHRPPGAR